MTEATNVRELLDRFEEQNWDSHIDNSYGAVESFAEDVVEEGTFIPDAKVTADLNLTLSQRLSGSREQDVTPFIVIGLMLGTALERDVPMDSDEETLWEEGEFELPE